ncbi:L,D-transpeptidase family protein [Lysobacter sp. N42]|uniref:L,D-transpeptidase family protein n=1 Tax=Lysobacter sp. N42 TaxID=2545719 RepID=UPI0010465FA2|nr:L,D-transpeptidase family protein [Lysobacter sp. N42]TCZ78019.1 L,D-transpeptidase [Lysobacter sp. N42]
MFRPSPFPRRLALAGLLGLVLLSPAAALVPPDWSPRPGQYVWKPELAPRGPVVVVASLPLQQLHVYRNGVRIGATTISSGKRGHETPVGVFTILQKRAEHYSNLYDNAPMPWMQRLTWDGIALHAGRLPGHPASHGCIRLPDAFAKALFSTTRPGDVVIVTDRAGVPGPAAGGDVMAAMGRTGLADAIDEWAPERAPTGPVSIVLSTRDGRLVVMRDGVRIGSARVHADPALRLGTRAWVLLEGRGEGTDPVLPDRAARRWQAIEVERPGDGDLAVRQALEAGALAIPPELARRIDALLVPGATVVLTDAPLGEGAQRRPLELETDATPR